MGYEGGGAGGNKVLYSEGSILKGVRGCFLFFYEGLGDGGGGGGGPGEGGGGGHAAL